ncbi:SDR family NAD(P)-dependent oxidoreductase [Alkalihalobacillus sp. FSL R5-0424]
MDKHIKPIAVVTGGGSGIGKQSAIQLAKQGYSVAVLEVDEDSAAETVKEMRSLGAEAMFVEVDVQKEEDIKKAFEKVISTLKGPLQAVVANAGVNGVFQAIEHMKADDWDTTQATNLRSTFLTTKHAIPYLKEAGGGSIVITSSINGNRKFSGAGMSAYSASKAGQVAFMKMAAVELGPFNIRVNAICPGAIDTNIGDNTHIQKEVDEIRIPVEYPKGEIPLGERGKPQQVANVVGFLCSDHSNHVSGMELYVDGAQSLL